MAEISLNGGHYCVTWYRDDDNNSGYGDNPRKAVWWGTREECKALVNDKNPPNGARWEPISGWQPDMSPGSAAWCESYER